MPGPLHAEALFLAVAAPAVKSGRGTGREPLRSSRVLAHHVDPYGVDAMHRCMLNLADHAEGRPHPARSSPEFRFKLAAVPDPGLPRPRNDDIPESSEFPCNFLRASATR